MPPVVQLERKWALEYGMPSTHAMVGMAVPLTIVSFIIMRYIVSPTLCYIFIALAMSVEIFIKEISCRSY